MRTDRLWDCRYLALHWRHYTLLLLVVLVAWSPQVLSTLGLVNMSLSNLAAFTISIIGNLNYPTFMFVFFKHIGPWMRRRWGVANTFRIWEFLVGAVWQGQTLAFWVGRQFLRIIIK